MRYGVLVIMIGGAGMGTAAMAQDAAREPAQTVAPAAAPAKPPLDLSGGVTLTSDYRFRGISQSNKRPALQGTLNLNHESGFYIGTWASSISNYVASGSDAEIDLYGGFKKTTAGGTTIDTGVLYYLYPDSQGATTNFFEPYANVAHAFGPVTAKVGTNFGWKQKALSVGAGKESAFYLYGELGATIPTTALTVTGHLGHSFDRNYITFGTKYTDWSLTAAYAVGPATLSLGYVDTDKTLFSYPAGGGHNRDVSKSGIVASVGFAF